MRFTNTGIEGAFLIQPESIVDNRGFFLRTWDQEDFRKRGLETRVVQTSLSYNTLKGSLRGLHYQIHPFEETKLVRCIRGSIYDVLVDLRPNSYSFKKWVGIELLTSNYQSLYIPEGVAHGFQTLTDHTEVSYQISQLYAPEDLRRGIRWDDPSFNIEWPIPDPILSYNDRNRGDWK